MSERLRYLGQSITVLSETTSVDSWCSTVTQSGLDYLVGPGGRAWAAHEEWGRNGYAYGSPWRNDGRYYHYDRLGSVSSVSFDKPGLCFADYDYGPFGDTLGGSRGYAWSGMRGTESIGFTGQRLDAESGLYHFAYREYDGLVAQWTTSDPIKDGEAWYAYCGNNPVGYTDPDGKSPSPALDWLLPKVDEFLKRGAQDGWNMQSSGLLGFVVGGVQGLFYSVADFLIPDTGDDFVDECAIAASCNILGILSSKYGKYADDAGDALLGIREAYVDAVTSLADKVPGLRAKGLTSEQIARQLSAERNVLKEFFRKLTPPEKVAEFEERCLKKYGNKLGPTIEYLRNEKGKTWEEIIESACRTGGEDLGL